MLLPATPGKQNFHWFSLQCFAKTLCLDSVNLRPSVRPCLRWSLKRTDGWTDGQTGRQTLRIEFGAYVTSGGNNFNEFPYN